MEPYYLSVLEDLPLLGEVVHRSEHIAEPILNLKLHIEGQRAQAIAVDNPLAAGVHSTAAAIAAMSCSIAACSICRGLVVPTNWWPWLLTGLSVVRTQNVSLDFGRHFCGGWRTNKAELGESYQLSADLFPVKRENN